MNSRSRTNWDNDAPQAILRASCSLLCYSPPFARRAQSPAFRVDPYWPKPLPNNWILGQVGGIAVDAQDNIWVFQRPRSLTDDEKGAALDPPRSKCCVPAPSVLVFNQSGDVVKSWGGPGENLGYDWPAKNTASWSTTKASSGCQRQRQGRHHGAEVHHRRKIRQTNRQTRTADQQHGFKPVRPGGRASRYDKAANEIYAADGYGNHRVAVLDADTGEIKRIWGAYGKPPTDDKLPPYDPDSPQFANPVHCVTLAKDGLVYVCDRSNNRVQVFHKDGSFVRQYVFDPKTQGPGSAWGLAFSPLDRKQKYFVLIDGTNNVLETVRRKDGVVVGTFGRPGRKAGEFHWVHAGSVRLARQFLYR